MPDEYNPYQPPQADLTAPLPAPQAGLRRGYGIPFSLGDVLSATFRLWAAALGPLVVINLPPVLLGLLVGVVFGVGAGMGAEGFDFDPESSGFSPALLVGGGLLFAVLVLVLYLPAVAGSFLILHDEAMGVPRRGPLQAFLEGFRFFWRILGSSLLVGLAMVGVMIPVGIGAAIHPLLAILFGLGSLCAALYLGVRWFVATPAIALEDTGAIEGLNRSSELVLGRWWPTFGIVLIFGLINVGIGLFSLVLEMIPVAGFLAGQAISVLTSALGAAFSFSMFAGLRFPD